MCGLHSFHRIILTFAPFGFSSASSGLDRYFAFAAANFSFAFSDALKAATVRGLFRAPAPRTLPGTTTTSLFSVCLFIWLKFTATRCLFDLVKCSATSNHMLACVSLACFFRQRISCTRSGVVDLGCLIFLPLFPVLQIPLIVYPISSWLLGVSSLAEALQLILNSVS